jgi:hypothetical protein
VVEHAATHVRETFEHALIFFRVICCVWVL